jgi:hypothetical protein
MTLDCAVEMPNCIVVGLLGGYILSIPSDQEEAMQRLMTSAAVLCYYGRYVCPVWTC